MNGGIRGIRAIMLFTARFATTDGSVRPTTDSLGVRVRRAALVSAPAFVATAAILAGIETAWSPLHRLDVSVADRMQAFALAHPLWVRAMLTVSDVGSPTVVRTLAGVLAVVLWVRRSRRLAICIAATIAVGALLDTVLKNAVGRDRPQFTHPVALAPGGSFPSGHAFTATLGAGLFLLWALPYLAARGRVAVSAASVAAAFVPLAVGVSRVALGVHWTTDVVCGWLLGIGLLAAAAVASGVYPLGERPQQRIETSNPCATPRDG